LLLGDLGSLCCKEHLRRQVDQSLPNDRTIRGERCDRRRSGSRDMVSEVDDMIPKKNCRDGGRGGHVGQIVRNMSIGEMSMLLVLLLVLLALATALTAFSLAFILVRVTGLSISLCVGVTLALTLALLLEGGIVLLALDRGHLVSLTIDGSAIVLSVDHGYRLVERQLFLLPLQEERDEVIVLRWKRVEEHHRLDEVRQCNFV